MSASGLTVCFTVRIQGHTGKGHLKTPYVYVHFHISDSYIFRKQRSNPATGEIMDLKAMQFYNFVRVAGKIESATLSISLLTYVHISYSHFSQQHDVHTSAFKQRVRASNDRSS